MPCLSIVIPVYNVEKYLAACLDSVLEPEGDYEIILVNDGSTDSSPVVAQTYVDKFPERIRMITTPNGGLGHARRVGTEAASGTYILYVDSDDTLSLHAVTEILQLLQTNHSDMIIFDMEWVTETGRSLGIHAGAENFEGHTTLDRKPELLFAPPCAWNKLYRRSLFVDNGISYPSRVWYEDLHTTPKLLLKAGSISYVPKVWYRYLQRTGSIMKSGNAERNLEIIDAVDDVLDYFRQQGQYEVYKPQLEYMCWYNALLTSVTRVNLIDRKSSVQNQLTEAFTARFPDWRANEYIQKIPAKYKLLNKLIFSRNYGLLHTIMAANEQRKK